MSGMSLPSASNHRGARTARAECDVSSLARDSMGRGWGWGGGVGGVGRREGIILLNVHRSEMAYWGRGQEGKGTKE